jgi:hypothetical protein
MYHSFEEVDKDIKILNLRRQIAMEQIKGDVEEVKDHFRPPEILSILNSGMLKKFLFSWLFGYLLRRLRK